MKHFTTNESLLHHVNKLINDSEEFLDLALKESNLTCDDLKLYTVKGNVIFLNKALKK